MVDPKTLAAAPPVNIHVHERLGEKDRARLLKLLAKEKPVSATPKPAPAKPGYLTTEFWVTIALGVGAVATSVEGSLPPRYAAYAATIAAVAYALSRGLAKH